MSESERARGAIKSFLKRQLKADADSVDLDTSLFAEGLGLDSLQTAELSVMLEDEIGRDPFSQGETPQTIAEVVEFYEK